MVIRGFNSSQNNKLQDIEKDLSSISEKESDAKEHVERDLDALQKFMQELPEGIPDHVRSKLNSALGDLHQAISDDGSMMEKVKDADENIKQTLSDLE